MKVAHLAEFCPHRTGLYGTTKDLIFAERNVGIDAVLVDSHVTKEKKIISRPNLKDGDLPIRDVEWAKQADIIVHHSIIHQELRDIGIPLVLAIHGRPESTFLLEHRRHMQIFGGTMNHGNDPRYKAFFTFWREYMFQLSLSVAEEKLHYVPAPVDLVEYSPEGNAHTFAGSPSILIADMWRDDITPFNTIMAVALFKNKYAPDAKIHMIGTAPKKSSMVALAKMLKKDGVLGEMHPLVETTALCYRGADMVVTPHSIATRVVREALACGTPIVAGTGNKYTDFTADSRNIKHVAEAINRCWLHIQKIGKAKARQDARAVAQKEFNPIKTGRAAKELFEKVLETEKGAWTKQDGLDRRAYHSYADYVQRQKSKLSEGIAWLKSYDKEYRANLRERLLADAQSWQGLKVLCLGARTGTEVKAFLDVGCFAIGVDLNPGKDNKYVVTGDFHDLAYADNTIDVAFSNSLDHVYRIRKFLSEVKRVLGPKGLFIVDLEGPKERDADKWASLHWESDQDLIEVFKQCGFALRKETAITSIWFRKQLIFQAKGGD